MVYFVTLQKELFSDSDYVCISVEESIKMMNDWKIIQCDTETSGKLKDL